MWQACWFSFPPLQLTGVTMFLSSFQSFIVISHAKHLLAKYGTMKAAQYLHKNNVSFDVALHLILGN